MSRRQQHKYDMRNFIDIVTEADSKSQLYNLVTDQYDRKDLIDMSNGDIDQALALATDMKSKISFHIEDFKAVSKNENSAIPYMIMAKGDVEKALEIATRDYQSYLRAKQEDDRVKNLIKSATTLATKSTLTYDEACLLIAYDDEMFGFIGRWLQNTDDAEADQETSRRFLHVLNRINPPVHKHLYRGQQSFSDRFLNKRGFHSWSTNRDTAEDFAEKSGVVLEIDRPIQGVSVGDILDWRMRITNESHYGGPQSEWIVVDQPEQYQ